MVTKAPELENIRRVEKCEALFDERGSGLQEEKWPSLDLFIHKITSFVEKGVVTFSKIWTVRANFWSHAKTFLSS